MSNFSKIFLAASWVIFFATGRSIASSILLVCSGAYAITELMRKGGADSNG
jgi:hypothetical protein